MSEDDRKEVKRMIDEAMAKHNRDATLISSILGFTILAFYSHGLFRVVESLRGNG